jgi:hypothetical protein
MALRMIGVRVSITRYVSDEPQPGLVECEFSDAHGRCWVFVEKTAVVCAEDLDAHTDYPVPGVIACEIVGRGRDASGKETVLVDTERQWGVESIDGSMRFEVSPTSLVEWEWGSKIELAWNGRVEPDAPADGPSTSL